MAREPYVDLEGVRAKLSFVPTWTASSKPNASQVADFAVAASNELDAHLAVADYVLPIATGATVSRELLRGWAAVGAAWMSAAAMPQGRDSKHEELYSKQWQAILKGIDEGKLGLDAEQETSTSLPRFPRRPDPDEAGASPYFTRGTLGDH